MARLHIGEQQVNENRILWLLKRCFSGLREAEIADELGWERRRVNNYLRALAKQGRIYKEGEIWQVDD